MPVRLALGPRDLENGTIELMRRDTLEKEVVPQEGLIDRVAALMDEIQQGIFDKARSFRDSMITPVDTWEEFVRTLDTKGGFVAAHWDGTVETEVAIKEATKAGAAPPPGGVPPDQGGEQGHDPLHPARRRRRRGRLHLFGQAVAPARALRSELLTGQAGAIDRIECKATAGTIRRRFSNFTYDPL